MLSEIDSYNPRLMWMISLCICQIKFHFMSTNMEEDVWTFHICTILNHGAKVSPSSVSCFCICEVMYMEPHEKEIGL